MPWGSETKAADGCIATFQLPDGELLVERFSQQTISRGGYARIRTKIGESYIKQAAARADELGARIVSLSTPTTILRDLGGTRAQQKQAGEHEFPSDDVQQPEQTMLASIGRLDLLVPLAHRRDTESLSIPRVTARKPTHVGFGDHQ